MAKFSHGENKQYYICTCSDRTEQKYQEEQIRRTQKMDALGKLTGGIAHDFNNILGVILGYAELIIMKTKDEPKLHRYITEIHTAGERGKKLTQKLLGFSRRKEMKAESVDINQLLSENQHMLAKSLTSKIDLKYHLADDLSKVWFDKADMEDVLINLCINSMHAMPVGGHLTIHTENSILEDEHARLYHIPSGKYVHITVTDTGIGMDETTKNQIFDPFFTTKGDIGTGLGLSQVYGFVQSSGGAINVYSEVGHGTSISMFFPSFIEHTDAKRTESEANSEILMGHGELILLVDDEVSLLLLGEEILSLHGYQVIKAHSGQEALRLLESKKNDGETVAIMISDIIMPEMDGYQLSKQVSELYPDIRIQLSSGFSDDRHLAHDNDLLHESILSKPYTSNELLKTIEDLLK